MPLLFGSKEANDQLMMEDPMWYLDDDLGPSITEEGTCSNCLYKIPLDDLETLNFVVEESGVTPGTPDGPAVHWATGHIVCPNCGVELPHETST